MCRARGLATRRLAHSVGATPYLVATLHVHVVDMLFALNSLASWLTQKLPPQGVEAPGGRRNKVPWVVALFPDRGTHASPGTACIGGFRRE